MKTKHLINEGVRIRRTWSGRVWAYRIIGGMLVTTIFISTQLPKYSGYLLRSLEGPIDVDDPELLEYIRNEILEPPSKEPYNLLGQSNLALLGPDVSEGFYREVLWTIFKDKREGFFLEAGALDGETMSNTLFLERELGWTGLLVEPDKLDFKELRTKHRKAWSANVCLSPNAHPSKEMLSQHNHYAGPLAVRLGFKIRAMHTLATYTSQRALGNAWFTKVQCLPLESLLHSLNVTKVDLMVLDVEGGEMAILQHLDLNKFDIQVLCLEWKRRDELNKISKDFEQRGYKEVARKGEDLILIKNGSPYMPKSPIPIPEDTTEITFNKNIKKKHI